MLLLYHPGLVTVACVTAEELVALRTCSLTFLSGSRYKHLQAAKKWLLTRSYNHTDMHCDTRLPICTCAYIHA